MLFQKVRCRTGRAGLKTRLVVAVVQLLSCVQHLAAPWTAARQASLSSTISWGFLKFVSVEWMMPSNHLSPLLLPPSIWNRVMRGNFDVLSGLKAGLTTSLPSVTLLFLGLFLSSVLGLCWAVQAFSSGEQGLCPVAVCPSRCAGFSWCGAWTPGHLGSVAVGRGL